MKENMYINNDFLCDVAIIGGGPAGCAAGISLAQNGFNVIVVDSKKFPRNKTCGGLLTQKSVDLLKLSLGITDIESVIETKSPNFELYEGVKRINIASTTGYTYCVSRYDFDYILLQQAARVGCKILDGCKLDTVDHRNKVLVAGKAKIKYKYLIGADGVNSKVAKEIGRNLNKELVAIGLQTEIPYSSLSNQDEWSHPKIYFGYMHYGWGWAFPKRDHITVGLAGLGNNSHVLKRTFEGFLHDIGYANSLTTLHISGAIIPYGTFIASPAKDGVFLVGDAAGFAEPITGEGIYYALKSGLLAAESIGFKGNNKEQHYCKLCNAEIIKDLKQAKLARFLLFNEPFHSIAVKKLRKSTKHMVSFMRVLSGEIDYKTYFKEIIRKKLRLRP